MKRIIKISLGFLVIVGLGLALDSCTDRLLIGDAFLEKAPGGAVSADTVFTNAEYTRQFLVGIYSRQYYGLPCDGAAKPRSQNYGNGHPDALTEDFQFLFANATVVKSYYTGALNAANNDVYYPFDRELTYENIHNCLLLMSKVDDVPGIDSVEAERMKDEARCLMAFAYFNSFRFYGGIPLVKELFTGLEGTYDCPRASVAETVDYIVELLDTVIKGNHLPWGFTGADLTANAGRWTLAGAMALKCKLLEFAASPLFNSDKPYYDGKYSMEDPNVVWYGNYDASRWTRARQAYEEFLAKLDQNGIYELRMPTENTAAGYRFAYRAGYLLEDSPEVLHSVRVTHNASGANYTWESQIKGERIGYSPTVEYVSQFPWADGTPFDWDKTEQSAKEPFYVNGIEIKGLDNMFIKADTIPGTQMMANRRLTRDPRLYENVACNGVLQVINWGDGETSGANWEAWVGGTSAEMQPILQMKQFSTGFRHLKYWGGEAFHNQYPHWVALGLNELYLGYAEALAQTGDNAKAIEYVDKIRARVGMKGLVECNPDKNLLADKDALLEEIFRENNLELAFSADHFFDLIRYKKTEVFEQTLHRLLIYRLNKNAAGTWERSEEAWYKNCFNKGLKESDPNFYEPSHFEYVIAPITVYDRYWWRYGFDCKWLLSPFNVTEINKGYGLIQNPGW